MEQRLEKARRFGEVLLPEAGPYHHLPAAAPKREHGRVAREAKLEADADLGELLLEDLRHRLVEALGIGEVGHDVRPAACLRERVVWISRAAHVLERGF